MKIGLLADTHIPQVPGLPGAVLQAFQGVDLILHAGDVYHSTVLDQLETVAPVLTAWGNGDLGLESDSRVKLAQVVPVDGIRIGVVHCLTYPQLPLEKVFGDKVDVVVFGNSHLASISTRDGVLFVNPGSPTLPNYVGGRLGTVGFLEVEHGRARAWLLPLSDAEGVPPA
ncbi:MAG: metallophosphoesterase family protein [Chloroflexi bacterium]|nr:metallophosphoesterase family protein [Chloroflexota bacterium]